MKLAIVIATYYRSDRSTINVLVSALKSVLKQTYSNYKIFLIGDQYEHVDEFKNICKQFPHQDKLYYNNLPFAKERNNYSNKDALWSYGGVNAMNFGVNQAIEEEFEYICHLDHDDVWGDSHLLTIKDGIESTGASWLCTRSNHLNRQILPVTKLKDLYIDYVPRSADINHSSVCMNFKHIPIRYIDYFEEHQKVGPAGDEYMWARAYKYIKNNNLKSVLINKLTCFHLQEGAIRTH